MTSPHLSVLLEEVVAAIAPAPGRSLSAALSWTF